MICSLRRKKISLVYEGSDGIEHLAIIMDGNRRWARQNALKIIAGHYHGAQNLKTIARSVAEHGIQHLTVFAFSRENWKRSQPRYQACLV